MKKIYFFVLICFLLFSSQSAPVQVIPAEESAPEKGIELRYPVILVHGIARNDRINSYPWGRIPVILREHGVEVYSGNTDSWGDIVSNAELLKGTVDSILENTNHERVNIIAHSKGGIDSRYLIWAYDYGDKVASLTTISTPHNGAEIADFFFNSRVIHTRSARRGLQDIGRMFGDVNPDIYSVNQNLTTENMGEFNANVIKDRRVYYQSFYSVMDDLSDDPVYSLSYAHIKSISGENDGLVSAKSASWGESPVRIPISLSHKQIIDQGIRKFPGMEIPDIYLDIVRKLGSMGF